MGLTLESKNVRFDMGYGGFRDFRLLVAKAASEELHEHYNNLLTTLMAGLEKEKRDELVSRYDAKIDQLVSKGVASTEVVDFLYSSDCEGELKKEDAVKIYELIKDFDDDIKIGYHGRPDCATMADMKRLLSGDSDVCWH